MHSPGGQDPLVENRHSRSHLETHSLVLCTTGENQGSSGGRCFPKAASLSQNLRAKYPNPCGNIRERAVLTEEVGPCLS